MPAFVRSVRWIALMSCVAASATLAQSDTTAGHRGPHFALEGAAATTVGACNRCLGLGQSGTEYSGILRIGGGVSRHAVLSAELDWWELDRSKGSESAAWELVTAQYYPSLHRGFYVSAGVGLAQLLDANGVFDNPSTRNGNGLGLTAGAGYDLHLSGAFFLTPSIDVLYAQHLGSNIGVHRAPTVIRAGISLVREPRGEIARDESKKYDGHHGLEMALGVGEGIKPASCAGCAGWGRPAGGAVYSGRVGWAMSPSVVVSADLTGWGRSVGPLNESAVWEMITTQYYPNPRAGLYFDAGVGRAIDDFHVDAMPHIGDPPVMAATAHALGLAIGMGYEYSPRSFFSMTPSLRVLYAAPQRESTSPERVRLGTTLISAGIQLAWR